MGVVYEAFDRELRKTVAIKTVLRFDAGALYRFKQEFRTLADVHHPNLVRLHELVADKGALFFVMELVRGTDFVTYVRSRATAGAADATSHSRAFDRLRPALRQLVQGVHALHGAGKLHRDIKPSNVLVTEEGRVVILDFGVATEVVSTSGDGPSESEQVGTAAYMAPEQALESPPTPASDWYSVGAMLYEALVGTPPFVGSRYAVIAAKLTFDVVAASAHSQGVPEDLEALCAALLQRDPGRRPTGTEILRRVGVTGSEHSLARVSRVAMHPMALIGRDQEGRALRDAFDQMVSGQRSIAVRIGGASGMGKSAVARRFLDELVEQGEAVVLRGRAYERESVPYKAFDSAMDALSHYLMAMDERNERFDLPRDIAPLCQVFPVLRRVPGIGNRVGDASADPQSVRDRAFLALRELLSSLATRQPLVLYIDDVQWGDPDSAALLLDLIRPPNAPRLLLLLTYRDDAVATSPFLLAMNANWPLATETQDVGLGPLSDADAQCLALNLMEPGDEHAQPVARAVARESKGSPFLIEELVRSNRKLSAERDSTLAVFTLGQIVDERLARMPDIARRLAESVAVAGRPLALSTLSDAVGEPELVEQQLDELVAERLVRVGFRDGREVLEPSHDRIRETIVEKLPAEILRDRHARLAMALERTPEADLEAIAVHLLGAGDASRGSSFAERAAEQAEQKLAFDQSARLYGLAVDTGVHTADEERRLRTRLAIALEQAGRGPEAADAYIKAAAGAPPLERLALERSAAEQLLGSGRIEEGALVLRRVLAAVGLKVPRTTLGAIASLLMGQLLLRLGGLRFDERTPDQVSAEDRARLDAIHAAASGFGIVDPILSGCLQTRFALLALRVGDRAHVLYAACGLMSQLAGRGGPMGKIERAANEIAERLLEAEGGWYAESYFQVCRGMALFFRGRWKEAWQVLNLRGPPTATRSVAVNNYRLFSIYVLFYLGRLGEEARRAAQVLADAERRGDLHAIVNLRAAALVDVSLAADQPDVAWEHIRVALERWTQKGFHIQHWQALIWGAEIELYTGNGERAYERLARARGAYARSLLDQSQFIREITRFAQARSAVASALDAPERRRRARLWQARKFARLIERASMPWTCPLASMVHAAAAAAEGNAIAAAEALRLAITQAEAADMMGHASAARHQLGCLLGDDEGRRLRQQAEDKMTAQGIRAPARFANMLLPGRWEKALALDRLRTFVER
jgi:hypothetical protein